MRIRTTMILVLTLLLAACGGSKEAEGPAATGGEEPATAESASTSGDAVVPVELATRNVSCGCVLEEIGTCGNYIEIDGSFVAIANPADHGLGEMAWCGQEGVTAESAGEIRDGAFHAETLLVRATD